MQQVNLYLPDFHPKKDRLNLQQSVLVLSFVLIIFAALGVWLEAERSVLDAQVAQEKALLEPLREQSAELAKIATERPDDLQLNRQISSAESEIRNKSAALETLKNSDIAAGSGFSELLTALAQPKSNRLWFTEITLQQDVLLLNGQTMNPSVITDWIDGTSRFKALNRQFGTVAISRNDQDSRVYDFELAGGVIVNNE